MLQLTTILFVIAASVLSVIHFIALEFSLYWRFDWFDIPVHFFGGTVVALGIYALYDFKLFVPKRWLCFVPVWLLSLAVIMGWEVFKLYAGKEIDDDFILDTIIDVCMGSIGSIIGYVVARQIRNI